MKKIITLRLLVLGLLLSNSIWAQNIVYPWRATTAIVKTGQTFEVWFNAASGQTVNSIQLKSPYITLNTSMSTVTGSWTYDVLSGNKYNQRITVTVPANAPADRYDLVLITSQGNITSFGGVKVLKDFKTDYYIMHWSDGHLYQGGYDTDVLLKRKDAMIKIANIIDPEIIYETGDNSYNLINNPSRETDLFIGKSSIGTIGVAKANAAFFMTPGDHEGMVGNDFSQSTDAENSKFVNRYYGLQFHTFKYGNGRFMSLNNAWGLGENNNGAHQYQVDQAINWLNGAGSGGNFFVTTGHNYDRMHKFINANTPLDLVLAGDKHNVGDSSPYEITPGGPKISYIVNSIRDHFKFGIYKVNNTNGTYTKPAGTSGMTDVLQSGNKDFPETWVTKLTLNYTNANTGTATSNTATIDNKFSFPISGARVRFVVPKGNDYIVTGGTVTQEFDGTTYHIVDVATDVNAISTKTVSIARNTVVAVSSVSLSPATASLAVGATQQLTATVSPSNASNKAVSYTSSNTAVATVNSAGLVTAVATGTTTITVTTQDGAKTASSTITVVVPVASVTLSPATATLAVGASQQLTATVSPSNASNKAVSYTSSNTAVATVNSAGLVTAVAGGTATITVTTQSGSKTASSTITVVVPVASVALSPATATLAVGATQQLTATVSPSNASNKAVSYASSNTAVATVNSAGLVTAVASGTATITVTTQDGAKTASSTITVVVPVASVALSPATASIAVGASQQLTATVSPSNATNKAVSYTSSNTAVATVNSAGLVTAVAAGTATITVTTQDGAKTSTTSITVSVPTTPPAIQILQAEDATLSGAVVATNQTDYIGSGFADYVNPTGDYIEWSVNVPAAGIYDLNFRYSLLSGSRPLELKVNNTVRLASIDFPVTGSWSTWQNLSTAQSLSAGANTIRLTTIGSNGGNIDQLALSPYLDTCDAATGWTSASANTLSYFTTDKKQGAGCVQMIGSATEEFRKVFSPSLNSGTTIANGVLSFWYFISDVTKTGTVRVELGSGAAPDVNELSWGLTGLVNGWNKIDLNFSDASVLGTPNLNALNFFRIYSTKTASITTRIDAILITKTSGVSAQKKKKIVAMDQTGEGEKSVSVYPNPFRNGTLSIALKGYENSDNVQIKVSNLLGQLIHTEKVTKPTQIDLKFTSPLTESVYYISVTSGNSKITKKLLVK
jgi:uncharacterized protein YjdB